MVPRFPHVMWTGARHPWLDRGGLVHALPRLTRHGVSERHHEEQRDAEDTLREDGGGPLSPRLRGPACHERTRQVGR